MIINEIYIKSTKIFVPWLKMGVKSVNVQRYFLNKLGANPYSKIFIVFVMKMVAHLQISVLTYPFYLIFYKL